MERCGGVSSTIQTGRESATKRIKEDFELKVKLKNGRETFVSNSRRISI
jgi:hypothetical protein